MRSTIIDSTGKYANQLALALWLFFKVFNTLLNIDYSNYLYDYIDESPETVEQLLASHRSARSDSWPMLLGLYLRFQSQMETTTRAF